MTNALKRIRKVSRQLAEKLRLPFYDNGVMCTRGHTPIIRMTSSGACYHCKLERKKRLAEAAEAKADYRPKYYLQFKKKDGTFEIVGPFQRRATAVIQYKRRYLVEYGEPCPAHLFSSMEED